MSPLLNRGPTDGQPWAIGVGIGMLLAALCVVVAGSGGCKPAEQIHSYSIPKEAEEAAPPELPAGRMLGAIVVQPSQGWFFKLMGPSESVAEHEAEFQAFLKTLRFAADGPPRWEAPAGWREEPGGAMRFATFVIDAQPKPLELTVTTLPYAGETEADYVLKNVNRWRNQLQLPPLESGQLAAETSRIELDGVTATTVNLEGKLAPKSMGNAPFAPGGQNGK